MKLGEFIGLKLLPCKDKPHHMLRQQGEGAKVKHLVAMAVNKLKNLKQRLDKFFFLVDELPFV